MSHVPSQKLREMWAAIGDDEPGVLCGVPPESQLPKYHGITYPKRFQNHRERRKWNRQHCSKGEHLFDECLSSGTGHSLHCDACGLIVRIAEIDSSYQKLCR